MTDLTPADLELLSAYLDGELAPAERVALERRLAAEPALRAELEALRAVAARVRALPVLQAPRDFRLDPAIYGQRPVSEPRWLSGRFQPRRVYGYASALSAAAAMVILLVGVLGLLGSGALPYATAPVRQQAAALPTMTAAPQIALAPTPTSPPAAARAVPGAENALPPQGTVAALAAESVGMTGEGALSTAEAEASAADMAAFGAAAAAEEAPVEALQAPPPAGLVAPGLRAGGETPATKSSDAAGDAAGAVPATPLAALLPTSTPLPTAVAIAPDEAAAESAAAEQPAVEMPALAGDPEALIGVGCILMALAVMFFALSRRAR